MTQRQKEYLAKGLQEVANLTVGALLLGQFLGPCNSERKEYYTGRARGFDRLWTVIGLGAGFL